MSNFEWLKFKVRQFVIKLFGIQTYAKEYLELCEAYDDLKYKMETLQNKYEIAANSMEKVLKEYENPDRVKETYEHRAYANGRRDAYAEMGIKALNARINGENLYIDENDNIIEEMDEEAFDAFCKEHEIEIDDLIEGDNDE